MTQWAILRLQCRTVTSSTWYRAVMLPVAASNLFNHETRYVNAFTRIKWLLALRRELRTGGIRAVIAHAFKHLVIDCKNSGWLVAGSSSAKSGSVLQ